MAEFKRALNAFEQFKAKIEAKDLVLSESHRRTFEFIKIIWTFADYVGHVMDTKGIRILNAKLEDLDDLDWREYARACDCLWEMYKRAEEKAEDENKKF